jgi:excisionase family DNA binding protein
MIKTNNEPSITKNTKLKFITDSESDNSDSRLFIENNSKWLNAKEAARYLRLSSAEVLRNMVCQRRIPTYRLGKSLRFKVSELDALIESSRNNRRIY